ncbi:hypothetical protein D9M69_525630 [compost metagenome]
MAEAQRRRHVRLLHEAEVQQHPVEAVAIGIHLETPLLRDPGSVLADHREQHHLLVDHLVVQQVVQQRMGYRIGTGRQEYRRAPHPVRRVAAQAADEDR